MNKSTDSNEIDNQDKLDFNFMPSASFGSNNLLPMHIDHDMCLSIVHVHCSSDISSALDNDGY